MTTHTVDEALDRFALIASAGSENTNKACAMTALAWIAGEDWSDRPVCAHPLLASWVIDVNDLDTTTVEQRQDLIRAGETGVIDTRLVPTAVLLDCWSRAAGSGVSKVLNVISLVAAWKAATSHVPPDIVYANLTGVNLRYADLRDANLRYADLRYADLTDAYCPIGDVPVGYLRTKTGHLVRS